jgi:diguanylate cyclase (GGDEF)-like protein
VMPFALTALGTIGVLALTDLRRPVVFLLGCLLAAMIIGVSLRLPWDRLPAAAQNVPPLAFFAGVVLLRDAGGGATSGVGPLVLLPVCWLALYSGRAALTVALAATGAVFLGPWLLIGGPSYPDLELRRGLVLMLVAGLVGFAVQKLVRTLHEHGEAATSAMSRAAAAAEQLAAVAEVRHSMQVNQDPREVICEGARALCGAAVAFLLEPESDAGLRRTAGVGFEQTTVLVPMDPARSAAADCLLRGRRLFIPDARTDARIRHGLRVEVGATSLLYEPVVRRGRVVAVLVVGWREMIVLGDAAVAAVSLMAVEAAVALEQADLLRGVQELARTDQLTGMPNRRAFDELLPAALAASAPAEPLCVALLDLDHFKAYNDTLGHPAGDRFLQDAASEWSRQLRGTDVLARYGGEEFAVVLGDCDLGGADVVLEKLRRATPHEQTVSIGIAQWDGQESRQALIQRADDALYQAKHTGRNRLVRAV